MVMTVSRAANYGLHGLHTRENFCLLPLVVYLPISGCLTCCFRQQSLPTSSSSPRYPHHTPFSNHVFLPIYPGAQLLYLSTTHAVTCAWVFSYFGRSRRRIGVLH